MTFAHYDFRRASSIHEHHHTQEEVWQVIEGELEMTIDDEVQVARAGWVGIVPSNVRVPSKPSRTSGQSSSTIR